MPVFEKLKRSMCDPTGLSLPQDGRVGPTGITLSGRRSVEVDGCRGLLSYAAKEIVVSVREGALAIRGRELEMKIYGRGHIAILGQLEGVFFLDPEEAHFDRTQTFNRTHTKEE